MWYTLITAAFLVPVCQLRSLHAVSYAATVSAATLAVALVAILYQVGVDMGGAGGGDVVGGIQGTGGGTGGTMGQLASGHDLEKLQEALNAAGSTTKVQGWLPAGHAGAGQAATGQEATGQAAHSHAKALFVDAPFMKMMSTSTTAIFAYGGQGLFMETMAEMRRPQDFPKVKRRRVPVFANSNFTLQRTSMPIWYVNTSIILKA